MPKRTAKPGPDPDVRALVAKYKPHRTGAIPRAPERGLLCVAGLERALLAHPDLLEDFDGQTVVRNASFRLEAWLRLYEKPGGKSFEKALARVKELEDALGAVSMWRDMIAVAKRIRLPAPAQKDLRESARRDGERLAGELRKRWSADPHRRGQIRALDRIIGRILDADLPDGAKDRAHLCRRMVRHCKAIAERQWDFSSLQGGIHELRRRLRWLPLYFQALDGAVQLSETMNPVPELSPLLHAPEATSRFIQMTPPTREPAPIVLAKSLVVANSRMIDDLGAIKDAGEHVEYLAQAVARAGVAGKKAADARVRELLGLGHDDDDIRGATERRWRAFKSDGVLPALVSELERP